MSEWLPIETLPKDSGMYLVFVPTLDEDKPWIGTAWFEPEGTSNMKGWQLLPIVFADSVTHWMHLPTPHKEPEPTPDTLPSKSEH